jgi:hypothetical protein
MNPYKVLTRPNTKKADIIRATLPGAHDGCHVYAMCASREQASELCRLLNIGLAASEPQPVKKRKARAR